MIRLNHPGDGYRIAKAAGVAFNPTADYVIAHVEHDRLLGGAIYQSFSGFGGSMLVHMAGFEPNWANLDMVFAGFDYPFRHCQCLALFGFVPENNTKALDIDFRLGFTEVARIADVYPGHRACVILRMYRDECRWLELKPRGEFRRAA
jgi:hypothetical protein